MNKRKVGNFRKTDHCLLRQAERNIPDELLEAIFNSANIKSLKRQYLIVGSDFLKRLTLNNQMDKDVLENSLVMRLSGNCITTFYFCHDPEYLFRTHSNFVFTVI